MNARDPDADETDRSRLRRRRRFVWIGYAVLLMGGGIIASLMVDRWLPGLVERVLRNSAADRGIRLETEQAAFGWAGGRTGFLQIGSTDFWLEAEQSRATWSPWGLAQGKLDGLSLEAVEANVDLSRLWPPPLPAIDQASSAPQVRTERPLQPASHASSTPEVLSPEDTNLTTAPAAESPPPLARVERVPWWRDLPLKSLLVSDARVNARYDNAVWPLQVSLTYAADNLKSEAQLHVSGDELDLQLSARELSNAAGWTAQGALQWQHPIDQLSRFFPETHPAHPARLSTWGLDMARLDAMQAEVVVRGTDERWDEIGLLMEGGPTAFSWEAGEMVLDEWILAARGAPEALEVNSGLVVSRWQHGPWSANDFQIRLERSASGRVMVETPHVAWTHALGWRGEATARHFSSWPKKQTRERVDEVQIAFSQATNPFFALRPFRFFINLRDGSWDGRLSALETTALADWAIVNARLQGSDPTTGVSEVSIDATLEHVPQARSVLRILGNTRKETEGIHSVGTLRTHEGTVLATWFAEWATHQPVRLRAAEVWHLEKVLPWLSTSWAAAQAWRGRGSVDWELTASANLARKIPAFTSQLTARLEDVALKSASGDWSVQGLQGILRLEANPFPRSRGLQVLRLDAWHVGAVQWRAVELQFSWPMWNRVQLEKATARWLGGTLTVAPFSFNPQMPAFQMQVALTDLDAKETRAVFSLPENVAGRVQGTLVIAYLDGRWRLERLSMHSLTQPWQVELQSQGESFDTLEALVRSLRDVF